MLCVNIRLTYTGCLKRVFKCNICLIFKIFLNFVDSLYNGILRGFFKPVLLINLTVANNIIIYVLCIILNKI